MINNTDNKESFEEWQAGFDGLSFAESAKRFRDKILESPELDKVSRDYFMDAFNYVMSIHKKGKNLDTNLMRIHMMQVKGYERMTVQDFSRVLMLLSLCGFQFSNANSSNSSEQ